MKRRRQIGIALMLMVSSLLIAAADSKPAKHDWKNDMPAAARERKNPSPQEGDAQAGWRLFQRNCASCHGKEAEGRGKKPSLHSERVESASEGELMWLLTNGSIAHGMPSWTKLPEAQRWQLVAYLKSLSK